MSTATTYTDQQEYIKFLKRKACKEAGEDCGCNEGCGGDCEEECGCCPAGLVAVYDDKGQMLSCMTPNDAELYRKNTFTCQDGYIKLYNTATSEFLGCVSEENFVTLNASVNP